MLNARYILRLMRVDIRRNYASAQNDAKPSRAPAQNDKEARFLYLLEKYEGKIKFNSHLEAEKMKLGCFRAHLVQTMRERKRQAKDYEIRKLPPLPVSLQYVVGKERLLRSDEPVAEEEDNPVFDLPYSKVHRLEAASFPNDPPEVKEFDRSNMDRWMTNYDYFDDTKLTEFQTNDEDDSSDEGVDFEWTKKYGTPDPMEKISKVPCGGCGALLHCSDMSIPGYIPSEIFKRRTDVELKTIECQRCHFLKEYNVALNVSVHPDEYEKLLATIEKRKALVVVMVDLLDFPCSIWPGIVDIIGTQRPIVIVGNKVDLLPGDSKGYLKRIHESLVDEVKKTRIGEANVRAVHLVSAKTGYGVEELISTLFKTWLYKGDVFLIGCTNVGKSSLFNALLQSDYCKVHAADLVQRATVSRWPGTTLNLLKFPINRPSGWKIYARTKRLKADAELIKTESELRSQQLSEPKTYKPQLIGHIGRTFTDPNRMQDVNDPFTFGGAGQQSFIPQSGIDDRDDTFRNSKWFYDTPGVVHPEQALSLLTAEELMLVLPKTLIRPKSYFLHAGTSIFIGGLARLDFIECSYPARFTVFCSNLLPVTITKTADADMVYEKFIGTKLFAVPKGNEERLDQWPGLTKHRESIKLRGEGNKLCCGDVVLSSAGWISVTVPHGLVCEMSAWTPEARGVNVRTPSMLPHAITLKGKRVRDTPAYRWGKIYVEDESK